MQPFLHGFADEIAKTASYPISKLLTSRRGGAALNAITHTSMGPLGALTGIIHGITGGAASALDRGKLGRALMGRIARGKGIRPHEIARLAEVLKTSPERAKSIIHGAAKSMREASGGRTFPFSRAATLHGIPFTNRWMEARGLSGRVAAGDRLTGREQQIVDVLKREKLKQNVVRGAGLAGAAGLAGLGTKKLVD